VREGDELDREPLVFQEATISSKVVARVDDQALAVRSHPAMKQFSGNPGVTKP
jgi:hypothetical protein